VKLAELEPKNPIINMGQTRWFKKINRDATYVIALDPAMGTGGDYSAIQVFEVPAYDQVAEWRSNTANIPEQIRILKDIIIYISEQISSHNNIYWSVENNTIGEAALIVINDLGEENIPGLFVSEPIRKGFVRKYRKGFNTTHSTKISACSRMKSMVEDGTMTICSSALLSELKNYVASGASYKAKLGMHDDLISAVLLVIRIVTVLRDWDPRVYNTFKTIEIDEDYEPPMPIFVSNSFN